MNVCISATASPKIAIARASLTDNLLHEIGGIFTTECDSDHTAFRLYLTSVFGNHIFRWYCIDYTDGAISRITFSNQANPKVLSFRGATVRIAQQDMEPFELLVQECDAVKPSGKKQDNKTYIG